MDSGCSRRQNERSKISERWNAAIHFSWIFPLCYECIKTFGQRKWLMPRHPSQDSRNELSLPALYKQRTMLTIHQHTVQPPGSAPLRWSCASLSTQVKRHVKKIAAATWKHLHFYGQSLISSPVRFSGFKKICQTKMRPRCWRSGTALVTVALLVFFYNCICCFQTPLDVI